MLRNDDSGIERVKMQVQSLAAMEGYLLPRCVPQNMERALSALPPIPENTDVDYVLADLISKDPRKVIVLDDDPTGTQTVHGVKVITKWSEERFINVLESDDRLFYVLTNSRSLPEEQAVDLTKQLVASLNRAVKKTNSKISIISRSDSTLRGHFPAETVAVIDTVRNGLGMEFCGQVVVPAFFEGDRYTFDDVHWVRQGDMLVPAAQTEFAKDPAFGFRSSNLVEWVLEKTDGAVTRDAIVSIPIEVIRREGVPGVYRILQKAPWNSVIVSNATSYYDLKTLVCGLLRSEADGHNYVYRTAASFVPIYGGISLRDSLSREELRDLSGNNTNGGLVVVGSHVETTNQQLKSLLNAKKVSGIELSVTDLLHEAARELEIARIINAVSRNLVSSTDTVIYTSRTVLEGTGKDGYLQIGSVISDALVRIVRGLAAEPKFLIAKGGITSSVLATDALGSETAHVLGQILPGVPVWRMGEETTVPGKPYVIFPGNVGDEGSLLKAVQLLS